MKRDSKVRYWQVSIAMALFGALAACSGANIDENGNTNAESTVATESAETTESADSLNATPGTDNASPTPQANADGCPNNWVCCEPYPSRPRCNRCMPNYRLCN